MHQISALELPRPLGIDKIPAGGMEEHIVARPTEREAVAQRLGLLSVARLEADLTIQHAENKMIAVAGKVSADVVQSCVVTLEPLAITVEERIDVLFAPRSFFANQQSESGGHIDVATTDEPEPIIDGVIDLGELTVQHLALALDPYPRKEGSDLFLEEKLKSAKPSSSSEPKDNPFAQLKTLLKP